MTSHHHKLHETSTQRCGWCSNDPLYQHYHDHEWGKPSHDRQYLFEMLCLEGQQAGLSWITVLKKRNCYRQCFFDFLPQKVALLTETDIYQHLQNPGLIRHAGKLNAIVTNARAWLALEQQGIHMVEWLWSFVNAKLQPQAIQNYTQNPVQTEASLAMSRALKKAGFKFVGPTICYAFMQAVGMVNDHEVGCSYRLMGSI
jgi:DNA-3-methyladenine glycosylase I